MMNKAKISSALLMDDAAAYFVNLKNTGNWKTEISRNTQIIALTMFFTSLVQSMMHGVQRKIASKRVVPRSIR